jgi:hypothetical protein
MQTILIGDVHSQAEKLDNALAYIETNADDNTLVIFLGDLFDSRGTHSESIEVYNMVRAYDAEHGAVVLNSNHQDKLRRYLSGTPVRVDLVPELGRTIREFEQSDVDRDELRTWLESCPYGYIFKDRDGHEYRCAHAYFPSWVGGPTDERYGREVMGEELIRKAKDLMLYGKRDHETKKRVYWWENPSTVPWTRVSGHYHRVHITDSSIVLDGCCGEDDGKLPVYNVDSKLLTYF